MEIDTQIELLDSDLVKIRKVLHDINNKYAREKDSKDNLLALVHELEDKFHSIGLEISLPMSKRIAWAMGAEPTDDMPSAITVSIDSRTVAQEFDHDQMAWEARKAIIPDGVAKKFMQQGGTVAESASIDATVDLKEKEAD